MTLTLLPNVVDAFVVCTEQEPKSNGKNSRRTRTQAKPSRREELFSIQYIVIHYERGTYLLDERVYIAKYEIRHMQPRTDDGIGKEIVYNSLLAH